ncbi:uncharacterized protein N0V89_007686 [Didymosphaeria variabile]|uniref:EthD domain-containing protein n=1 Tax=Didymosphaeria variabile TaxID=1932322 RepID=A0A9W8XLM0_9PLEO|nr:uncharacterized protein N0V89_007686 [Didymosphaeria variabile]KAJ4352338.1 hypothetical protein N0V89_007686 [Didymosphaeria variabile]
MIVSFPALHPQSGKPITFNRDYYLNTHIANVAKEWLPYGYLGYHFNEFLNPNPVTGQPPEYAFQTVGYFETLEGLFKAAEASKEASIADTPNFTDEGVVPSILIGTRSVEKSFK